MSQIDHASNFADRLQSAIARVGSPVCVGLDPVADKLPKILRERFPYALSGIDKFCRSVLEAVAGVVPVVKFQSACFERYGGEGVSLLAALIERARNAGLMTILDAKRGDIGISAEHYAYSAFGAPSSGAPQDHADALTVSGYLGPDTIEPFLHPSRGVFVLVRTSNAGSDSVQSVRLADGRSVAEMMADQVASLGKARLGSCGLSSVGAVVGATKPGDAKALRARMPDQIFLVPGYGAQGGKPEDVRDMLRPASSGGGGGGVLVTASRSVIFAFSPDNREWTDEVRTAAERFRDEIKLLVKSGG